MNIPLSAFAQRALDRWVLLHGAEASAEALPSGRRAKVLALHRAGSTRVEAALGEHGVAALLLARAATPCYLEAAIRARAPEEPPADARLEDLWGRYDDIVAAGFAPPLPPRLVVAREHMMAGGSPDGEIAEHGEARVDEAVGLATFVGDGLELRSPRAIRFQRMVRKSAALAVVLVLAAETVIHRPRSANVALHANVVASSRRAGVGPPQDLTNGKVEPSLAFATKDEPDPWVNVNLGSVVRISEVTLTSSDDHKDDSIPLRVETSPDGAAWEPAALQSLPFSQAAPAVLTFATRGARFVRIHGRPSGAIYLNEIEVR